MPGAIEAVHPNKFLANLRPVEDFRHTPLIPISQKEMRDYQKKVEEKNRKGYYVEIRKDTLYFYSIALITFSIIVYAFLLANDKQMRIRRDIERTRVLRRRAYAGKKGMESMKERERDSVLSQKPSF
mmetsp:Transcript_10947/g.18309  ORF Transcript_10947/g.18309 Transcript_10947/m.18309 type:complete len:127 (-) Transcript_10947:47-427(-)